MEDSGRKHIRGRAVASQGEAIFAKLIHRHAGVWR